MWSLRRQSVTGSTVQTLIMTMGGGGATGTDLERAAKRLREDVATRARAEVARHELEHPTLIEVAWQGSGRPVQPSPDVLGVEPGALRGTVTGIPDLCRRLPSHQLVVLGEPGTGKSVLALLLVHAMAGAKQEGESEPVPVLMSLASWRPAIPMREWIVRQIEQISPRLTGRRKFGPHAAARLFDGGDVMPVLDGLDELPEPLRAEAVQAIDHVIANGWWLLVTSRRTEYEEVCRTGAHLTRAAVVELEAVEAAPAITYLDRAKLTGDDRWSPVLDVMREEPESAFARTMTSPLMLYLARTAYRPRSTHPGELLSGERSQEDIEDILLDQYLPAVYAEHSSSSYKKGRAERYLRLIARQMRRDRTVDFAWWQIDALLTGPVVGLAFGGLWGWFMHALFGPMVGIATGGLAGIGGLAIHYLVRSELRQVYVPRGAAHGPTGLVRRYLLIGVASALTVAGVTGASVGVWLARTLRAEDSVAWRYGTVVGAASFAATLLGSAWGSYQVSHLWFGITRRLPWKLTRFLEDATRLGVLRQAGAVHQFRHQRLQSQLGGGAEPSRSVHGQWNATWLRWRPLLPVFASAAQVASVLAGLGVVSMMYASTTLVELDYRSGEQPVRSVESATCFDPAGAGCPTVSIWSWRLPRRASTRTVWSPTALHSRSVLGWSGAIGAEGCSGGSVRMTWVVEGAASVVLTLDDSEEKPVPDLPRPVRAEGRSVTLTLRRLDQRPCALLIRWIGPGLFDDALEPARERLGVASPVAAGDWRG